MAVRIVLPWKHRMMMGPTILLLLALFFTGRTDGGHDGVHHHDHKKKIHQCGTTMPDAYSLALDQARMQKLDRRRRRRQRGRRTQFASCQELVPGSIEIPTYFHFIGLPGDNDEFVVPHPTEDIINQDASNLTSLDDMLLLVDAQMDLLNREFASSTPFYFTHVNRNAITTSINVDYTFYALDYQYDIATDFAVGDLKTLNVYMVYDIGSANPELENVTITGVSSFPSHQLLGTGDGILLRYDTLPGGGMKGDDDGFHLVHEAGKDK